MMFMYFISYVVFGIITISASLSTVNSFTTVDDIFLFAQDPTDPQAGLPPNRRPKYPPQPALPPSEDDLSSGESAFIYLVMFVMFVIFSEYFERRRRDKDEQMRRIIRSQQKEQYDYYVKPLAEIQAACDKDAAKIAARVAKEAAEKAVEKAAKQASRVASFINFMIYIMVGLFVGCVTSILSFFKKWKQRKGHFKKR